MPIENEIKYILPKNISKKHFSGWKKIEIKQAYLPDSNARIRNYEDNFLFTYKIWSQDDNAQIEIEASINEVDFNKLWRICDKSLEKTRYIYNDDNLEWVADFLKNNDESVYFVLAEVEMPEGLITPPRIPKALNSNFLHICTQNDKSCSNKKLSDPEYAESIYKNLAKKV